MHSIDILQGRVGLRDQRREEFLEPGSGLGRGLVGIRESTVEVESGRRRVAGAVAFTSGLGPDDGVDDRDSSVGRRARSEASALDVAPVTPCLTDVLHAGAALVDDEVGGESRRLENGGERIDVVDLVVVGVSLSDGVGGGRRERVVVCNVGGQATDETGRSSALVQRTEELSGGRQVGGPSQPSSVSGVKVGVDVAELVQLLDCVCDAGKIGGLSVGTFCYAQVGDQVGKTVGFDDGNHTNIREFLDLSHKLVNVVEVVSLAVVGNAEFSVGSRSSAISVGQVVDDDLNDHRRPRSFPLSTCVRKVCTQIGDLGNLVEPGEGGDLRNRQGRRLGSCVRNIGSSRSDLSSVERREVNVVAKEGVSGRRSLTASRG